MTTKCAFIAKASLKISLPLPRCLKVFICLMKGSDVVNSFLKTRVLDMSFQLPKSIKDHVDIKRTHLIVSPLCAAQ